MFSVTPVTGTVAAATVTAQVAVLPPSSVVTVMVAVPGATAVTTPSVTVAMLASLVLHVTFLLVALSGSIVAVSRAVPPSVNSRLVLSNSTLVTL